jgi:hypothetical protein
MWTDQDDERYAQWFRDFTKNAQVERTGVCPDGLSETGHIVTKPIPDAMFGDWSC